MNCEQLEKELSKLKVNATYSIRGKNKVIDAIHSLHLKRVDNILTDIRIAVAKMGNTPDLKQVDEIIYKIQTKL